MNSIYALHNYVKYMGLVSLSNICILATSCFYFESFFFFLSCSGLVLLPVLPFAGIYIKGFCY